MVVWVSSADRYTAYVHVESAPLRVAGVSRFQNPWTLPSVTPGGAKYHASDTGLYGLAQPPGPTLRLMPDSADDGSEYWPGSWFVQLPVARAIRRRRDGGPQLENARST